MAPPVYSPSRPPACAASVAAPAPAPAAVGGPGGQQAAALPVGVEHVRRQVHHPVGGGGQRQVVGVVEGPAGAAGQPGDHDRPPGPAAVGADAGHDPPEPVLRPRRHRGVGVGGVGEHDRLDLARGQQLIQPRGWAVGKRTGRRHPHQRLVGACQCPASQQRHQQRDRAQTHQGSLRHATAAHHNLPSPDQPRLSRRRRRTPPPSPATGRRLPAGGAPHLGASRMNHRGVNPTMSSAKGRLSGCTWGGSRPALASDRRGRPSQPDAPRVVGGKPPGGRRGRPGPADTIDPHAATGR
jgi:hypothetical protein